MLCVFQLRKASDSVPYTDKLSNLYLCPQLLQWIHVWSSTRFGPGASVVHNLHWWCCDQNFSLQFILYADDVALYIACSISSPADYIYITLQADITAIVTCVEEEKHLKLHVDKCNFMLISRKRTCSILTPPLFAKVGSPLKEVESVKYLYTDIMSDLSYAWNEHITRICNKTRKLTGLSCI